MGPWEDGGLRPRRYGLHWNVPAWSSSTRMAAVRVYACASVSGQDGRNGSVHRPRPTLT
jgi:hypothetical protein